MRILSWLLTGLIAGFIGSKIGNRGGEGLIRLFRDVILGIVGAMAGGYLFEISGYDVTRVNLWSILAAVIGSIIVLWADHLVRITASRWRRLFPPGQKRTTEIGNDR